MTKADLDAAMAGVDEEGNLIGARPVSEIGAEINSDALFALAKLRAEALARVN